MAGASLAEISKRKMQNFDSADSVPEKKYLIAMHLNFDLKYVCSD
jgi:hypothetical protein